MIKGRAQSLLTLTGAVGTVWMLGCMNPTDSSQSNATLAMSQSGSADSSDHGGGVGKTTICHIPPGNPANAHTITVGNPAVKAHLAHGDKLGACKDMPPAAKPCSDNPGTSASHDGLALDRSGGKVAICHIPPGNPANAHTIVVGAAAVKAHLAHGDYLGTCKAETTPAMSVDCGSGNGHSGGNSGHDTSHDGGTGGTPPTDTSTTGGGLHF
ncbi:MAG: hypothetical protein JF616_08430 [Fibrobacteres bacterium]|nr:hypothetical protein [Fibrobacterota bacterium]